uniref:DNA polymerase n=1 Tax=Ixodes ricinus TaxID=34613 RepID=A0A131XSZ4_IXORI
MFIGSRVYIVPTGMGKPRVQLFLKKLVEHGAEIADSEKDATHVVVAECVDRERLPKLIDSEKLSPSTRIVRSAWISDSLKNVSLASTMPYALTCDLPHECGETVLNSDCAGPSGSEVGAAYHGKEPEEPARSECADVPVNRNAHIIEQLQAMVETYQSTKDQWRALSYERAIMALKRHPTEITSWEEARSLPKVGERLADKIWEIVERGKLRKLEEFQGQGRLTALQLFTKIWGSGPSTAERWVHQGFTTLEELASSGQLTGQQKIGLKHFHDFLEKMPREEAGEIADTVAKAALSLQPGLTVVPCGSYRRGKSMCGDVDVLISHAELSALDGLLNRLLQLLRSSGFLTDDLAVPHGTGVPSKYMGVCRLDRPGSKHRRLDVFVIPPDELACALLAYTGSAHFNRSLRLRARRMGMALSDRGLREGVWRKGAEKRSLGSLVSTPTEASILEHLGLSYRPPEQREQL